MHLVFFVHISSSLDGKAHAQQRLPPHPSEPKQILRPQTRHTSFGDTFIHPFKIVFHFCLIFFCSAAPSERAMHGALPRTDQSLSPEACRALLASLLDMLGAVELLPLTPPGRPPTAPPSVGAVPFCSPPPPTVWLCECQRDSSCVGPEPVFFSLARFPRRWPGCVLRLTPVSSWTRATATSTPPNTCFLLLLAPH